LEAVLLDGTARQLLFSVILFQSIYLCLYAYIRHCKALGNHLTPGVRRPECRCT